MGIDTRADRRRTARVGSKGGQRPVTLAHYFLLSDPRMRLSSAPVLDIGADGLSLLTPDEIPVGSSVQLFIEPVRPEGLDDTATLGGAYRLLAEVHWVGTARPGKHLVGLAFLPVSTAEARNRKGLKQIMETYEGR